nr:PREDICTED: protein FAM150A [Balearica regulorum gibbericeps]
MWSFHAPRQQTVVWIWLISVLRVRGIYTTAGHEFSRHDYDDIALEMVVQIQEIFPRDSSLKDKFIKHFTGPVTFSSECSKHFHRLYHNTRDCSTPAYYKRCARLLTRLAMSPLCTQS